ncbi:MAG: DUF2190 family protein [Microbacterium enclense]
MANECIPLYTPASDVTVRAASAIVGKTFVALLGGVNPSTGQLATVVPAPLAGASVGVASRDTASGAVMHLIRAKGIIVPVTAGGDVSVGAEVEVGANGRAVTLASGKARGRAWSAGTAGNDVFVELY